MWARSYFRYAMLWRTKFCTTNDIKSCHSHTHMSIRDMGDWANENHKYQTNEPTTTWRVWVKAIGCCFTRFSGFTFWFYPRCLNPISSRCQRHRRRRRHCQLTIPNLSKLQSCYTYTLVYGGNWEEIGDHKIRRKHTNKLGDTQKKQQRQISTEHSNETENSEPKGTKKKVACRCQNKAKQMKHFDCVCTFGWVVCGLHLRYARAFNFQFDAMSYKSFLFFCLFSFVALALFLFWSHSHSCLVKL